MNISEIKLGLTALWGFINPLNIFHPFESAADNVISYLLNIANQVLAAIDPDKRAKIAAAYNTLCKVLATMTSLAWLVPTKWQSAYRMTISAVSDAANALADFKIEAVELTKVKDSFNAAVLAWRGGDVPDTDVDFDCPECVED